MSVTARKVTRYYTDCGQGFWKKQAAENHSEKCKCWENPNLKTCKSCRFGRRITDNNGGENQYYQEWKIWECSNKDFKYYEHFTPAHEKAEDLCINCPVWVSKKEVKP